MRTHEFVQSNECEDVSSAGKRRGIGGERSGLWRYFAIVVKKVRPRIVVVENVASGKRAWLPTVRQDLHLLGYRTRAVAISAAEVGAPHLRRRVFVVAYANGKQLRIESGRGIRSRRPGAHVACGDGETRTARNPDSHRESAMPENGEVGGLRSVASGASAWASPPVFRGVDDGLPRRLDGRRLKALGNAVVPQCAEVIGRMIVEGM